MGHARDVTARRKRADYRIQGLPKGMAKAVYEIILNNAKAEPVTVEVTEAMIGEWCILSESQLHKAGAITRLYGRSRCRHPAKRDPF